MLNTVAGIRRLRHCRHSSSRCLAHLPFFHPIHILISYCSHLSYLSPVLPPLSSLIDSLSSKSHSCLLLLSAQQLIAPVAWLEPLEGVLSPRRCKTETAWFLPTLSNRTLRSTEFFVLGGLPSLCRSIHPYVCRRFSSSSSACIPSSSSRREGHTSTRILARIPFVLPSALPRPTV